MSLRAVLLASFCLLAQSEPTESTRFPDRSTPPILSSSAISVIAVLDHLPGNIAAAPNGDLFFTYHPVGYPDQSQCPKGFCGPAKVMRLREGQLKPFPNLEFSGSPDGFQTVLGLRVDAEDRLWVLDHGNMGKGTPALFCFDIVTHELLFKHAFKPSVVGEGSMLNDLVVSPDGRFVYIADCSIAAGTPAIVVFDAEARKAWRTLEGEDSVRAAPGIAAHVNGEPLDFPWAVGVDSIAISQDGDWLYFGSIYDSALHRVAAHSLTRQYNTTVTVEKYAQKSSSDGIVLHQDTIYLTDFENSAITMIDQSRTLTTLVHDKQLLRWPDGISAHENQLFVTCSAIHELISGSTAPPYHILSIEIPKSDQEEQEL